MTYKEVNTLAPVDAAYLAGLIDGEGTVTLSRLNPYKQMSVVVTVRPFRICNRSARF
jgi:hypothetical protein